MKITDDMKHQARLVGFACSFAATIAYGLLSLAALVLAALWTGSMGGLALALLATGLAYGSQGFATNDDAKTAVRLQLACVIVAVASGLFTLLGA